MKTLILTLLLFGLLLTIASCDNNQSSIAEIPFKETKIIYNDFYTRYNEFAATQVPSDIAFIYKCQLLNKSNNTYNKVAINVKIKLILDNGNVLTENEYGTGILGEDILEYRLISNWKPNEERENRTIVTTEIPVKYLDYPVQKVIATFKYECEDQINNTNNTFIEDRDITNNWIDVIKRVKTENADFRDFDKFE